MKQNEANKPPATWTPPVTGKTVLFVPAEQDKVLAAEQGGISGGGLKRSKNGVIAIFVLLFLLAACLVPFLNRKKTEAEGPAVQVASGQTETTAAQETAKTGQVAETEGPAASNTGAGRKAESDTPSVAGSNSRAEQVAGTGNNTSQGSSGGAKNIPRSSSAISSSAASNTGAGRNSGAGAGSAAAPDAEARARDAADAEKKLNWACEYYWQGRPDLYRKYMQESAELGNAWAQACYGNFFLDGTFRKNESEAVRWFRKAADQECLLGYDMLKRAGALSGTDAEKAKKAELESERWLAHAFELHYQGNYSESLRYLKMAAERGNAWAQLYYGEYLWREFGMGNDKPSALAWLNMSAGQSCPGALYDLWNCYKSGVGVNQNESTAAALYNKYQSVSAEAENLRMQAYELKQQGNPAATDYLRLAAERGNAWAQMGYGEYLGDNNTAGRDEVAAVSWFFLSATAYRCPQACFCLGWCYENGRGVNADLNLASQGYQEAVQYGVNGAQTALNRVNARIQANRGWQWY